jgi:hypothetical protein
MHRSTMVNVLEQDRKEVGGRVLTAYTGLYNTTMLADERE